MTAQVCKRVPLLSALVMIMVIVAALPVRANSAGNSSEVLTSFLAAAQDQTLSDTESTVADQQDYAQLMQKYREASARDPLNDLLQLFPVASRERIDEFRSMDDSEVAQLISDNPPEQRILALVVARSPRIARAENAWRATLNRYPQTLFLQDLLNRYQSFTSGLSLGIGEEYQSGMIQMDYPIPGMLSLRGRAVEIDAEIAYRDYLREASETIADTKVLLAQIRNRNELNANSSASSSLLSVLGEVAQAQYIAGTRSFSDLVRIQSEQAKRRDETRRLKSERDGLLGSLAASLSLPPNAAFGEIGWPADLKPALDEDSLRRQLPESRQELIQSSLELEKMDVMIQMTRRQAIPDATLGMSYVRAGSGSGDMPDSMGSSAAGSDSVNAGSAGTDTSMSGIDSGSGGDTGSNSPEMTDNSQMNADGSSFVGNPMVDHRRTNFGVDFTWAAELGDRRAEMASMLENMTDMASGMLEMQIIRYDQGLQSEITYSGKILPDAQAALDVVRIGYSGNENSFSDLINAELALLEAGNDLANLRMDRRIALAEIERLLDRSISSGQ